MTWFFLISLTVVVFAGLLAVRRLWMSPRRLKATVEELSSAWGITRAAVELSQASGINLRDAVTALETVRAAQVQPGGRFRAVHLVWPRRAGKSHVSEILRRAGAVLLAIAVVPGAAALASFLNGGGDPGL
ncbi:hypothetical protein GCM10010401_13990 [Rarobacter faecitabidus]|uniref:Uncharacterized protein n=1 Tax=Rarobacter faecitabidus TaxID=13243 RepID=A0A542ZDY1_RARFA|nr:hypothetical protein [Rarobacter faecitabidus]TQL58555.1 hypothetical protein FB461_1970 [Rarobacter faecitabidus]